MKDKILVKRLRVWLLSLAFVFAMPSCAQELALKTNFLYWATLTPNIGAELSVSNKSTIQAFYGLNPWKTSEGKSIRHWVVQPEYRYWFCTVFDGWFVGVHAMGGQFNMGNVKLPFGAFPSLREHRYEGWFAGGGVSAGYQWVMSKHWNFEAEIGVGYDYIKYDKYKCGVCGEKLKSGHTNYVGPTKAALSLVYLF